MKTLRYGSPLLIAAMLLASGCDLFKNDEEPEVATIAFHIDNVVGGRNLALNTGSYTNAAGQPFSVSLLEYIVTDIALHQADGTVVDLEAAHYCNEADAATHELHEIEIPAGAYTALTFTFGVKEDENTFGMLPNTTEFANMMWPMMMPMGDGVTDRYHYMRFEGAYGDQGQTFRIHAGPSGGGDYSFDVSLPLAMDVESGADVHMHVNMNVDQWLTGPNTWNFDDFGMIMGNPAAQSLVQANGSTVFTLGDVHF
ncbi:MAG: MbnP family protein [Rhodothermales bacterium]